jgi:hypothetical protein
MMEIQLLSSDTNRMLLYQSTRNKARTAVAQPPLQGENTLANAADPNKIKELPVLLPDNKIPKVEELKEMIKANGYPYKSDIYKAITRIID